MKTKPTTASDQPPARADLKSYAQRTLVRAGIYAIIGLVLLVTWYALDMLLLLFAGILLAVFLRGLGRWLSEHTPLSTAWAVGAVTALLLVLLCGGVSLLTPLLIDQARGLSTDLPQAVNTILERLERSEIGRRVSADQLFAENRGSLVEQATSFFGSFFSGLVGTAANLTIILFVGLYVAAKPRLYQRGVERLVPPAHRRRASEVLTTVGYTLQYWLVGQFFSVMVVGTSMVLGYWIG